MNPREWLQEKMPQGGKTRIEVLASLVGRNGFNFRVGSWGCIQHCGSVYGEIGLDQSDAILLMEMGSYFHGLLDGRDEDLGSCNDLFEAEFERQRQLLPQEHREWLDRLQKTGS